LHKEPGGMVRSLPLDGGRTGGSVMILQLSVDTDERPKQDPL
jgi:hypothetical protein